jgi:hypothetical protein
LRFSAKARFDKALYAVANIGDKGIGELQESSSAAQAHPIDEDSFDPKT